MQVSLQKGKGYVGMIGVYRIPPGQKARLNRMSSKEIRKFYYTLKTELAKNGYDWDTDPPYVENPNAVIPIYKGPPETVSTKADFLREITKVLNGLSLVTGYFNKELGDQ
jgi:hypothetical protein